MKTQEALEILKIYNDWRTGKIDNPLEIKPKTITETIDFTIEELEKTLFKEELAKFIFKLKFYTKINNDKYKQTHFNFNFTSKRLFEYLQQYGFDIKEDNNEKFIDCKKENFITFLNSHNFYIYKTCE